eukprot:144578_1
MQETCERDKSEFKQTDECAADNVAGIKFLGRSVKKVFEAIEQSEGKGARVRRAIGNMHLRNLDPFLLLDEFAVAPPAGFPAHPHRGFETVTYMTEGSFKHRDFKGHAGIIGPGDLQWMTAGKGIVHSEMPAEDRVNRGLQLWVNLPKSLKMMNPNYQELKADEVPLAQSDGVKAKVIAGKFLGVEAAVRTQTKMMYIDFTLDPDAVHTQEVPSDYHGFAYVLEGDGIFGKPDTAVDAHHMAVLGDGDTFTVKAGRNGVRFILICGVPINEEVVQYGPFVMNTQKEINQAFFDYQSSQNGFEGAQDFAAT